IRKPFGWRVHAVRRLRLFLARAKLFCRCGQSVDSRLLSTPFHKYDHVCGEGFSAQTRRERRAYPSGVCKARATTSGPKRTAARGVASLFGSGVVAPRSSRQVGTGDAPSSRLARTEKRRDKHGRIYEMEYLGNATDPDPTSRAVSPHPNPLPKEREQRASRAGKPRGLDCSPQRVWFTLSQVGV